MWIAIIGTVLLGIAGGTVSTLIGFGSGMILAVALALIVSPLTALAVSSVALMMASLHRALLFRAALRGSVAGRWAAAIMLGSSIGGAWATSLPDWSMRVALVVAAAIAIFQRYRPLGVHDHWGVAVLAPAGGAIGFVGGGTAGVGPIASSLLMATGHAGERYIGLMAVCGVALNAGRVVGYGSAGIAEPAWLAASVAATIGMVVGNLCGRRIRTRLEQRHMRRLEQSVPWGCLVLALLGLLGQVA